MAFEPSNADLYNIIHRLNGKIENLERKIDKITENREFNVEKHRSKLGLDTPELFEDWSTTFNISRDHYELVFALSGGVVEAFKQMLLDNIDENTPLFKYKRAVYVYMLVDGEPEWCLFNEENLRIITQEIWRKTLAFQLAHLNTDDDNDDVRDVKRRVVLQMRQKLFETRKTKQYIYKWLRDII